MSTLMRLEDIVTTNPDLFNDDYHNPVGNVAYGVDAEELGKINGALVDDESGEIRYFIVDAGGWFSTKEVLVPAGLGRFEGDKAYFDSLTREQVEAMDAYDNTRSYSYEEQAKLDRTAFNAPNVPADKRFDLDEDHYKAPKTLELLEERLTVNKDRIVAGLVKIGKHVVTEERKVEVELEEEQAHIHRKDVDRKVDRQIGDDADRDSFQVELEAERAHVGKETYVTEEVSLDKSTKSHTETIHETIQREELDVDRDGNVIDRDGNIVDRDGITADDVRAARNK